MVIGKIGNLAVTILAVGLGFVFLKQAYGSSIGSAGTDVGTGLQSTATGVSSLISAFIDPITSIFGTISGFLGGFNSGGRNEPSPQGRDERATPDQLVKSGDEFKIVSQGGSVVSSNGSKYSPSSYLGGGGAPDKSKAGGGYSW